MWTDELFGTAKPIIALLHLDALPGDPGFTSLSSAAEHAAEDLAALEEGGADGVLIANETSLPYSPGSEGETVMAMAYIIGLLKKSITVPFGVNVVLSPEETIRLAAATGAAFARSAFSGAYSGEYGVHAADFGRNVRLKYALGRPELRLLCKVNPEGDAWLAPRSMDDVVGTLCAGGYADALCVSGPGAGQEANSAVIAEVRQRAEKLGVPVFCNTGCRRDNIADILAVCDGACVGTAFKNAGGRVDAGKVRAFMDAARNGRRP